jgi:uncharacterized protein YdeI (YjbR/CyaY-like superfamily)
MGVSQTDIELSKYWPSLSPKQKRSLLDVIKSFSKDEARISIEKYNQELAEAETEYNAGSYITSEEMLKLINQWK